MKAILKFSLFLGFSQILLAQRFGGNVSTEINNQSGSLGWNYYYTDPSNNPKARDSIRAANNLIIDANRFGLSPNFAKDAQELNQRLLNETRVNEAGYKKAIKAITQEMNRMLEAAKSSNPQTYIGTPTPLPPTSNPDFYRKQMDPLFEGLKDQDPIKVSDEIARLQRASIIVPGNKEYFQSELQRNFTDHRGILRDLPESAKIPEGLILLSTTETKEGVEIRHGINLLASSNMVLASAATNTPLNEDEKAALHTYEGISQDLLTGLILADRLNATDLEMSRALLKQLMPSVQFIGGITKGILKGSVKLGENIRQLSQWAMGGLRTALTQSPLQTLYDVEVGIYKALSADYLPTLYNALNEIAEKSHHTLLYGSAEEKGELLGRAVFEVLSSAYGGKALGVAATAGGIVEGAVLKTLDHLSIGYELASQSAKGLISDTIRTSFVHLAEDTPVIAAELISQKLPQTTLEKIGELGIKEGASFKTLESLGPNVGSKILAASPEDAVSLVKDQQLIKALGGTSAVEVAGESFQGLKIIEKYHPLNPGPLLIDPRALSSFRSGTYTKVITTKPITLYRVISSEGNPISPYWSLTPSLGPTGSIIDKALIVEFNNNAIKEITKEIPIGKEFFIGVVSGQNKMVGGGIQAFVPLDAGERALLK